MSSAGLSGSSAVGIIVNPNAGKDIRRLTSASGQTSDAVKIGIMRRAAVGALEMGADRILFSSDTHHLAERAVEGLDGVHRVPGHPAHRLPARHRGGGTHDVEGTGRRGHRARW